MPKQQLGVCAIHIRCAELIQELHRDFPQTQEGQPLEVRMHTHNKKLPTLRQLVKSRQKVSDRVRRKTRQNLKAISHLEQHKELTERNKKREFELKRNWPKRLVRFTPDWKGGFELGGGGLLVYRQTTMATK